MTLWKKCSERWNQKVKTFESLALRLCSMASLLNHPFISEELTCSSKFIKRFAPLKNLESYPGTVQGRIYRRWLLRPWLSPLQPMDSLWGLPRGAWRHRLAAIRLINWLVNLPRSNVTALTKSWQRSVCEMHIQTSSYLIVKEIPPPKRAADESKETPAKRTSLVATLVKWIVNRRVDQAVWSSECVDLTLESKFSIQ